MATLVEVCNKGHNSNLKNLLVINIKIVLFTGTSGFYSGVYPWFFSSVFFGKLSSLNYMGSLTLDEMAFARLYPGNHNLWCLNLVYTFILETNM